MNVLPAWHQGFRGKGVVVSILDDGIQPNHPDLAANYVSDHPDLPQCLPQPNHPDLAANYVSYHPDLSYQLHCHYCHTHAVCVQIHHSRQLNQPDLGARALRELPITDDTPKRTITPQLGPLNNNPTTPAWLEVPRVTSRWRCSLAYRLPL